MSSRPITPLDLLDRVAKLAAREYECPKYEYQPVQPYGSEQIDCHLCHGTGRVPLFPELREPSLHSMGYGPVGNMWLPILHVGQSPDEQQHRYNEVVGVLVLALATRGITIRYSQNWANAGDYKDGVAKPWYCVGSDRVRMSYESLLTALLAAVEQIQGVKEQDHADA